MADNKVQKNGVNNFSNEGYVNTGLNKLEKSWGNFAPLASSRGKLSGGSDLSSRLNAMKRKPLPPLRRGLK